ncbi:hypothetical protein EYF80_028001 [Liparis tanakae]|uniref:Uncharacterized protein n=1 Tax=Liparis tanakae TaxID=230148 RepID=A0A4Z2H7K1_9TELE|nr:hypothetical protein EYF80_028001 [Liparis tanakae]
MVQSKDSILREKSGLCYHPSQHLTPSGQYRDDRRPRCCTQKDCLPPYHAQTPSVSIVMGPLRCTGASITSRAPGKYYCRLHLDNTSVQSFRSDLSCGPLHATCTGTTTSIHKWSVFLPLGHRCNHFTTTMGQGDGLSGRGVACGSAVRVQRGDFQRTPADE